MARTRSEVKRRVEAEYDREERTVEDGVERIGQMTIAFCGDYDRTPTVP